ncbi:hypothetical protein [Parvimonas micra]
MMKKIWGFTGIVIVFCVISGRFLWNLNEFNIELSMKNVNILNVMIYQEGKAWKYLIGSTFIVLFSGAIEYCLWKFRKDLDFNNKYDIVVWIILMLVIFIITCLTIYFIQNPILRAAFIIIFGGFALFSTNN